MSTLSVVLLVLAAAVVAGAEWPRIARGAAPGRQGHLRIVRDVADVAAPPAPSASDADEFVASVFRDLDRLPTADRDRDR